MNSATILLRSDTWYFSRRVPVKIKEYDPREYVRFSLKTDSRKEAERLAVLENKKLEEYWAELIKTGAKHSHSHYKEMVGLASLLGFSYTPIQSLAAGAFSEIFNRLSFLEKRDLPEKPTEALIGTAPEPEITVLDALEKFWHVKADIKINKTEKEARKWRNPRKLAVDNFIRVNGDIPIKGIKREHMRRLKDWWIIRIEEDEYSPATANKDFRHVKAVITTAREEYGVRMTAEDVKDVFGGLEFNDDLYEARKPFTSEFILKVLLNPANLIELQGYEIGMIEVMSETGLSMSELTKILPEDIHLNCPYPHVEIRPRAKMMLKTKHRRRTMPLVGFALDAFKRYPQGFRQYTKDADEVTTAVNSHFRNKELFPSEKHSLYSLRHSFQDRLTNSRCGERIQVDLMGHKFDREKYGDGGSLQVLHEEVKKIQLKPK